MELVSVLIGGLGIGSLLTALVNNFVTRRAVARDRLYAEKREAYLGLLNTLHQAAVHPSNENSKQYALWQTRCDLFGSADVAAQAQKMTETNDGPREHRVTAFRALVDAMKVDLMR